MFRCQPVILLVLAGLLLALPVLLLPVAAAESTAAEQFPQGVAVGDVTDRSAVLWTRSVTPSSSVQLEVFVADSEDASSPVDSKELEARASVDNTVQVEITDLEPATTYRYRFVVGDGAGDSGEEIASVEGRFTTAPAADADALASVLVGGDLGGQQLCRHVDHGYQVFAAMADLEADLFIANGDMIYADDICPPKGPGGWRNVPGDFASIRSSAIDWRDRDQLLDAYWGHWRYNRADARFRQLLATTPIYGQWDDHEVINDFGAAWPTWAVDARRPGYPRLIEAGRDAFFAYNPISTAGDGDEQRIYRSFRWGKHLELFLLDARSYRSPNELKDLPQYGKTLLGAEQLEWLERGLLESDATWKLVSSDVPLSIPTGSDAQTYGRDGFATGSSGNFSSATGAERELIDLLTKLDAGEVENLVFVATDVHFAMHLRYDLDIDGDGDRLLFHELISGPLNAWSGAPKAPDYTLQPTILYAEGELFNFSYLRLERGDDGRVRMIADIRDRQGKVRPGSRLVIEDRSAPARVSDP